MDHQVRHLARCLPSQTLHPVPALAREAWPLVGYCCRRLHWYYSSQ